MCVAAAHKKKEVLKLLHAYTHKGGPLPPAFSSCLLLLLLPPTHSTTTSSTLTAGGGVHELEFLGVRALNGAPLIRAVAVHMIRHALSLVAVAGEQGLVDVCVGVCVR